MANDPNNPQREEVLRRERIKIKAMWWVQARVEAAFNTAATIAICPDYVCTRDNFVELATRAFDEVTAQFKKRVEISTTANEDTFALASSDSPTNKKQEIES